MAVLLLHTAELCPVGHMTVKPVANWLIVIGCQSEATQDAEDINN